MPKLPFIIIFDVDKTLIGDIRNMANEYYIMQLIHKLCKQKGITNVCPSDMIDIQDELKSGLIRQHITDFIDFCDKKYKNAEICIYTHAAYRWAHTNVIPNIEKALNRKFLRPYFTREDCLLSRDKVLSNIYHQIVDSVCKKYPAMKEEKYQNIVFDTRLLMIDDIDNNLKDFPNKQIVCPAYTYKPYSDVQKKLIEKYKVPEELFDNAEVLEFFEEYDIPIYNENGSRQQKDSMLQSLLALYNTRKAEVSKYDDRFFLDLIDVMKNISVVNDKAIEKINKQLTNLQDSSGKKKKK